MSLKDEPVLYLGRIDKNTGKIEYAINTKGSWTSDIYEATEFRKGISSRKYKAYVTKRKKRAVIYPHYSNTSYDYFLQAATKVLDLCPTIQPL